MILASRSPRRRRLMELMGLNFRAIAADLDESPRPDEEPRALVRRLATAKAVTVAQTYPSELVVACDTVVALGRDILGKPRDVQEAQSMLQMLSGRRHAVYTGVAVFSEAAGHGVVQVACTQVTFRVLGADEIAAYVQTGEPMDKAGGYAIQGGAGAWVQSYEGDVETVIGLPRDTLARLLTRMSGP